MNLKVNARQRQKRRNTRLVSVALILFLIVSIIMYYRFLQKPVQVNSGIFLEEKVFSAHAGKMWEVRISTDGSLLASASIDSTVKIWKMGDGTMLHNLKHPIGIAGIDFSNDGKLLITAGYDAIIRLWSVVDGLLLKEFKGHTGTIWSLTFNPDNKTFASTADDLSIRLWEVESGKLIRTMTGHKRVVWSIKISPDGKTLASGSFDKSLMLWNLNDGKLIRTLTGHTEAIVSVGFSKDGQLLASGGDDGAVRIWSTKDYSLLHTFKTEYEHVYGVAISPDNTMVIAGTRDRPAIGEFLQTIFGISKVNKGVTMRLWDLKSKALVQTFSAHEDDVVDVAFTPDGKRIASASNDHTVRLWKMQQ